MVELKQLSQLSKLLNTVTGELNAALTDIESQLNGLTLGVEAWVTNKPLQEEIDDQVKYNEGEPTRKRTATEVGYAKLSDGWALAVRTVHYGEELQQVGDNDWDWFDTGAQSVYGVKALLRASRSLRAAAVDRLPDLFGALHEAGMKMTEAVKKARTFSESLK